MAKKTENLENTEVGSASQSVLSSMLKKDKNDHHNFVEKSKVYKLSTGSLIFDSQIGGGINTGGLLRCVGFTEGGKTSFSLQLMREKLKVVPKSKGLWVDAEGRANEEICARAGMKFVWTPEEWVDGTCFVLQTNVYDFVINLLRELVVQNPESNKYFFLLDSMDALILKSDMEKDFDEAGKVAGAPALTKKFLQKLAVSMSKNGHTCDMTGQVSAQVQIDPYAKKEIRQISATGGNAALHFSNWIFQFEPRFQSDYICENPSLKYDPVKNPKIGHWCKIIIKKSPNEKTDRVIRYPIKYGRTGGDSIWREYEVIDVLSMYGLLDKKGAWVNIDPTLIEDAAKSNLTIEQLHQGIPKFQKYLEDNKDITDWLFTKLKETTTLQDEV